MKKVYIPAGETASYNSLDTGRVVVHGTLRVTGKLTAKEIIGSGNIEAGEIVCNDMRVFCATANWVTARKIAADKLFVYLDCRASEQIAVRDYLSAGYVCTGTLSVSLSNVGSFDADKVIIVRQRGSLLGLLWASWWRGLYLGLFHRGRTKNSNTEGSVTPAPIREDTAVATSPEPAPMWPGITFETTPGPCAVSDDARYDDTIGLMITVLSDLKDRGYRVMRENPANEKNEVAA